MCIVFMQEPEPTSLDLRWRMFGVPIRVHPLFWLLAAILGWGYFETDGFGYFLLWIGCVFVSILLHEFGHVLSGRAFGSEGHILLYVFGGLAIGSSDVRSRWKRVVVYLAGPLAQLLLLLPLLVVSFYLPKRHAFEPPSFVPELVGMLVGINSIWPLFNLLPIYPLDGGQVTREIADAAAPGRGALVSLVISAVCSAGIAMYLFAASQKMVPQPPYIAGSIYNAIIFASFAASSIQALQIEYARSRWDDRLPWER
jgi:Zn-dependent protease